MIFWTIKPPIPAMALLLFLLIPAGCSKAPSIPEKRYPMKAEVVSLVPQAKDAILQAGPIGDWMGPMTMEYPIRPQSDFARLKVGDQIKATVVVQGDKFYVTEIQIMPAP